MVPVEVRMLYAMLSDQIQTLGMFHRRGMWHADPSELGEWLRQWNEAGRHAPQRQGWLMEMAMHEWRLWGRGTDVLLETMEAETIVRLDRSRIVELAIAYSRGDWSRGTTRTHVAA